MKNILFLSTLLLLTKVSYGQTVVFGDDFAGTDVDPWWTYTFAQGAPNDFITQDETLTFDRAVPNISYYFGRHTDSGLGSVTNVAYVSFEISNFNITSGSGNPFFRISSDQLFWSGTDTALTFNFDGDGAFQIFLNNSASSIAYSDGNGVSGNLDSASWIVYRDGAQFQTGVVDPASNLGNNVAVGDTMTSLGWGIFGNTDSEFSFDVDNFELFDTATVPEPSTYFLLLCGLGLLLVLRRRKLSAREEKSAK